MLKFLRGRWWLALVLVGVMLVLPVAVSAVTAPDALAGLRELFSFFLGLADKAVDGYKEFLKAL